NAGSPVYTEFRDDRFTAAFERRSGDPPPTRSLMSCAPYRPGSTCCPKRWWRRCTSLTASAAPGLGRSRSHRQNEERSKWLLSSWGRGWRAKPPPHSGEGEMATQGDLRGTRRGMDRRGDCRSGGGALTGLWACATRARSRSLDARARPERQAAARLSDERRPLAASGDEGPGRSTLSRRASHL